MVNERKRILGNKEITEWKELNHTFKYINERKNEQINEWKEARNKDYMKV